jgi:hypothetical protein
MLMPQHEQFQPLTFTDAVNQIENDETTSAPGFFETMDVKGFDEVAVEVEDFVLDSETSIDLYPQVADKAGSWRYLIDDSGSIIVYSLSGTTRKNKQFSPIPIRGIDFRILVGSTGTAGDGTVKAGAMGFIRLTQ